MAETKINKLPVLERRLHNYGQGMDFFWPVQFLAKIFSDQLPGASVFKKPPYKKKKIKATKEGAAGLKVGSLSGESYKKTKTLNKKYLAQFFLKTQKEKLIDFE